MKEFMNTTSKAAIAVNSQNFYAATAGNLSACSIKCCMRVVLEHKHRFLHCCAGRIVFKGLRG
eukprot:1145110-Pelagomonas_calceolata.AAC.1